jgi:hypothetical protein
MLTISLNFLDLIKLRLSQVTAILCCSITHYGLVSHVFLIDLPYIKLLYHYCRTFGLLVTLLITLTRSCC